MQDCRRFHFIVDMNRDGIFSISDVILLLEKIFYLPANAVVGAMHHNQWMATFFEIDCRTGNSWGGAIFSLVVWMIVISLAALIE